MPVVIGCIEDRVLELLDLEAPDDFNIYIGEQNIAHMRDEHPYDYEKYGCDIETIIANPDYVGYHNDSIEYVKEYKVDDEYVKVAVRVSLSGKYYARTLFTLNKERVETSIEKGLLLKY